MEYHENFIKVPERVYKKFIMKRRLSKLQWSIIQKCTKNARISNIYECTIDDICDEYFGKRGGRDRAKLNIVWRSIRNLDEKGFAKLRSGKNKRVRLTEKIVEIIEESPNG